jgi:hypothetical protein
MAGDSAQGLAFTLPPISDFCPRPAHRAAPARGAAVPGGPAARRRGAATPPQRDSLPRACDRVNRSR